MKKWRENHYGKLGLTLFLAGGLLLIFYQILSHYQGFGKACSAFIGLLSPFIYGIILAYLLAPLYNWTGRLIYSSFARRGKIQVGRRMACIAASVVVLAFLLLILTLFSALIVPRIVESATGIIESFPANVKKATDLFNNTTGALGNQELARRIREEVSQSIDLATTWIENKIFPGVGTILERLTNQVILTLKTLFDLFVGIIVCFYVLNGKDKLVGQARQCLCAVFSQKTADRIFAFCSYTDKTMGAFISGKIFDSLLIGFLCYFSMVILRLPYPVLIATAVAVTNIIPYFGPFLSGIPAAAIIFLIDPVKALIFIIMIIIIQQLEGYILEPLILGSSVGISGFWVIFAILMGGGLFGFPGMILGVPVFGIFYHYIGLLVKQRLTEKGLRIDTEAYKKSAFAGHRIKNREKQAFTVSEVTEEEKQVDA